MATSRPDCPRRMTFLRTCVQTSSATARRAPLSGVFLSQPSPVTPHGQVSAWACRHLANVPWPYARPTPSHDYRAAIRTSCGSIEARVRSPGGRAMQVPRPAKRVASFLLVRGKNVVHHDARISRKKSSQRHPGDPEKGERSSLFRVLARTPFKGTLPSPKRTPTGAAREKLKKPSSRHGPSWP